MSPPPGTIKLMRRCNRCGVNRDEAEFYRRKESGRRSDAFQAWCKKCRRAREREKTGAWRTLLTCSECGQEFQGRRSDALTCSLQCARLRKIKLAAEKKRNPREDRECIWCDALFTTGVKKKVFCSKKCLKASDRLRNYKLSVADFRALFREQEGLCPICLRPIEVSGWKVSIDHCHKTGRVRGLLHIRCNTTLGLAWDDPDVLRRAIDYLETAA